jgi:hypothetical protein
MILLLREAFKRRSMEGYKTIHHYADIGLTAGVGSAIALAIGADTELARAQFETAIFLTGVASLVVSGYSATASEPDPRAARTAPLMTKLFSGAALGAAIAATTLTALPGPDGATLRERVLQDNQDYISSRQRQKAAEKEASTAAKDKNVSHETYPVAPPPPTVPPMNGIFPANIPTQLAQPQARGPGL